MKRIILAALVCAALTAAAQAQGKPATESSPEVRRETFEIVWRTVKEKHFDPTFGGLDWDKVKLEYAPRVDKVKTDQELYALLQQMVGELQQSHFNIIPPEAVVESDSGGGAQPGHAGLKIDFIDGQAVITRVEPGSAAERAGLRPGFVIKQVDATTADSVVERFKAARLSPMTKRVYMSRVMLSRINGRPGTTARISYLDGGDAARAAAVERGVFRGEMSAPFGNFPAQHMEFESRRLAGGVGYIRFNIFVTEQMGKIRPAIRAMSDAPGIIIDLRDNPGGMGSMAPGIAGLLETRQTSLGVMKMRVGHQNFAVFPQKDPYTGPVVILINSGSGSTSEVFASGMQEIGRAVVVGERSMGAALPSIFQKLPTGALFQFAFADFKTPKGVLVEGRGVKPDVEVKLTRRALLEGRDPQLEAALEQVKKRSAAGGR
jgi:carboxyl-terminal processing protease